MLQRSLDFCLAYPAVGLVVALSLPAVGFLRSPELRNQFFPAADRDQFYVQVWLPRDASIGWTQATAQSMEQQIREAEGVTTVNWLIGGSIPTVYYNMLMDQDEKPSYAQAVITATSPQRARALIPLLQRKLDAGFPHAQTVVKQLGQGPPVDAPVEIRIYGPSLQKLRAIGQDLQRFLFESPQVLHTQTSFDVTEPKLWVDVSEVQLRLAGLSLSDVADQLQSTLEGVHGGSVLEETEELPVRVRFANPLRGSAAQIAASRIVLPQKVGWTSLAAVGDLTLQPQTPSIHRHNGERSNTVKAYIAYGALAPEVTAEFSRRLQREGYTLPPGYRLELGGDAEERASAMGSLFRFAPVLGILMLATVVLSFRSFLLAGILASVAVLSAGLAFLNLWLFDFPLGFNPLIGTAGLIGIALNDSIVVLAQIRSSPAARRGNRSAVVAEVMKTSRHVLATTLTTIGGFVPLLLSGGDFWPPLAIVIAGGVGGASIIALYFVPAAYILLQSAVDPKASAMASDSRGTQAVA